MSHGLKDMFNTVALRHDRDAARYGLKPWLMMLLIGLATYGWLTAEPADSNPFVMPLAAVGFALPLVLFVLMGPIDMFRRATSAAGIVRKLGLVLSYCLFLGLALFTVSMPFESPLNSLFARLESVHGVFAWFGSAHDRLAGIFADASSVQMQVGAVWSAALLFLFSQLLALRGASLRDPELATTYKGVDWIGKFAVWSTVKLVKAPVALKQATNRLKQAPANFKGARDEAEKLSSVGDVLSERPGATMRPTETPARQTPPPQPAHSPRVLIPSVVTQPSTEAVMVGGQEPPWARG